MLCIHMESTVHDPSQRQSFPKMKNNYLEQLHASNLSDGWRHFRSENGSNCFRTITHFRHSRWLAEVSVYETTGMYQTEWTSNCTIGCHLICPIFSWQELKFANPLKAPACIDRCSLNSGSLSLINTDVIIIYSNLKNIYVFIPSLHPFLGFAFVLKIDHSNDLVM